MSVVKRLSVAEQGEVLIQDTLATGQNQGWELSLGSSPHLEGGEGEKRWDFTDQNTKTWASSEPQTRCGLP